MWGWCERRAVLSVPCANCGDLDTEIEQFYRRTRLSDELIGLRNAVKAAQVVTEAAWQNKRSMGCHFRADSI